jgi:hypothetical protein
MGSSYWAYLLVAAIGGAIGYCELLARYRDEPKKATRNLAASFYIMVNVFAAVLALLLIDIFQPGLGADPTKMVQAEANKILLAGLGAMAFFRTSLFNLKVADKDIPVGPGLILQVLLDVTDRAVDRGRATPRALAVSKVMQGVDFDKAKVSLSAYCFGLMQNVSEAEQAAVGQQITSLDATGISANVKSQLLGLLMLNIVGENVLTAAIEALGDDIR